MSEHEQDIDLRDETQFLREIIERLLDELKDERRAHEVIIYPPTPIILPDSQPYYDKPWFQPTMTWLTSITISGGENLCSWTSSDSTTQQLLAQTDS